jgi:hypothetical protein
LRNTALRNLFAVHQKSGSCAFPSPPPSYLKLTRTTWPPGESV